MAAPFYAYTGRSLKGRYTIDKKHLVAKLHTSYAVMKSRFYLDALFNCEGKGVIGAVLEGGENAKKHNLTTRKGVGRVKDMVLLNDAGLNTKGVAIYGSVSSQMPGGIAVSMTSKSAWYVDTDDVSVKWKKSTDSVWQENFAPSGHAQQTEVNLTILLNSVSATLTPGEDMNIKVCNYNYEGVFESDTITIQVPPPSGFFAYNASYASYAYSTWMSGTPAPGLFYFNSWELTTGTIVYSDDDMMTAVGAGYYANDTSWFQTDLNGEIIAVGSIGSWPPGDPATPVRFIEINYAGQNSNWGTGCSLSSTWTPVTLWLDNVDNVVRTFNNPSASLANGFFYTGNKAPNNAWEFVFFYNGVTDGYTYNCTDGFIIQP